MKERTLRKDDRLRSDRDICFLVLFNDEVNTFDHVIKVLVEVCGHDPIQAEQCALIVHSRGSYEVKIGSRDVLTSMRRSLVSRGLKAKVESL